MSELDQMPRARAEGLLERQVENDIVVYDLGTDDAHLLNEPTARVWKACDGRTTVREIIAGFGGPSPEVAVWQALEELDRSHLLQAHLDFPPAGMSRRSLLRKAGLAALAIPVITTIAASPAAAAVTSATCSTGACNGNVMNCQPNAGATACGGALTMGCMCTVAGTPATCACR